MVNSSIHNLIEEIACNLVTLKKGLYKRPAQQYLYELLIACESSLAKLRSCGEVVSGAGAHFQLLASNVGRLIDDDDGDITFEVNGSTIKAHSCIVSLWSEPFRRMLRSGMKETASKRIIIDTEGEEAVREMVRFFYTAKANMNDHTAVPLLRLADLYQVEALRKQVTDYLLKNITAKNCIPLLNFTSLHLESMDMKTLHVLSLNYIRNECDKVIASYDSLFDGMTPLLVAQIMHTISPSKYLCESRMKELGRVIVSWAKGIWQVENMAGVLTKIITLNVRTDEQSGNHSSTNNSKPLPYTSPLNLQKEELDSTWRSFYDFCVYNITAGFEDQYKSGSLQDLEFAVFDEILQRDDLAVSSESVVLDAVVSWAAKRESSAMLLTLLLPRVRLSQIDTKTLLNVPNTYPILKTCPKFEGMLKEALQSQLLGSGDSKMERKKLCYRAPTIDRNLVLDYVVSTLMTAQPPTPLEDNRRMEDDGRQSKISGDDDDEQSVASKDFKGN